MLLSCVRSIGASMLPKHVSPLSCKSRPRLIIASTRGHPAAVSGSLQQRHAPNGPASKSFIQHRDDLQASHVNLINRRPCNTPAKQDVRCQAAPLQTPASQVEEPARRNLMRAANALRRYGWISFWVQLALNIISAVILLFSVAFTSQNGPGVSLYLTLFGIVAGFFSTFWSFGFTRLARSLRHQLDAGPGGPAKRVKKSDVMVSLERGSWINLAGMASTLLGLQATVGLLVAKTLTNATANPFLSGGTGSYNPVLALDVFLVQASTNTLLAHFFAMMVSLWLLKVVGRSSGPVQPGQDFVKEALRSQGYKPA